MSETRRLPSRVLFITPRRCKTSTRRTKCVAILAVVCFLTSGVCVALLGLRLFVWQSENWLTSFDESNSDYFDSHIPDKKTVSPGSRWDSLHLAEQLRTTTTTAMTTTTTGQLLTEDDSHYDYDWLGRYNPDRALNAASPPHLDIPNTGTGKTYLVDDHVTWKNRKRVLTGDGRYVPPLIEVNLDGWPRQGTDDHSREIPQRGKKRRRHHLRTWRNEQRRRLPLEMERLVRGRRHHRPRWTDNGYRIRHPFRKRHHRQRYGGRSVRDVAGVRSHSSVQPAVLQTFKKARTASRKLDLSEAMPVPEGGSSRIAVEKSHFQNEYVGRLQNRKLTSRVRRDAEKQRLILNKLLEATMSDSERKERKVSADEVDKLMNYKPGAGKTAATTTVKTTVPAWRVELNSEQKTFVIAVVLVAVLVAAGTLLFSCIWCLMDMDGLCPDKITRLFFSTPKDSFSPQRWWMEALAQRVENLEAGQPLIERKGRRSKGRRRSNQPRRRSSQASLARPSKTSVSGPGEDAAKKDSLPKLSVVPATEPAEATPAAEGEAKPSAESEAKPSVVEATPPAMEAAPEATTETTPGEEETPGGGDKSTKKSKGSIFGKKK